MSAWGDSFRSGLWQLERSPIIKTEEVGYGSRILAEEHRVGASEDEMYRMDVTDRMRHSRFEISGGKP